MHVSPVGSSEARETSLGSGKRFDLEEINGSPGLANLLLTTILEVD
jgi:hypothetical protein